MRARHLTITVTAILGLVAASTIAGTPPIVYPAKNQTPQQQQKDEGECAAWAKQNTGIDPVVLASTPAPTTAPPPAPAQTQPAGASGTRVRGAARGAAAGAVVGEIANDDASEGAAVGAAAGVALASSSNSRPHNNSSRQLRSSRQRHKSLKPRNRSSSQPTTAPTLPVSKAAATF